MNAPKAQEQKIEDDTPVRALLGIAMDNLDRKVTGTPLELLERRLEEHWFSTAGDLRLALKDGDAWRELGLPLRLKLELKRLLKPRVEPISFGRWTKMFDEASETWYYYDHATGESQWDPPEDVEAVEPEASIRNGFRSPTHAHSHSHSISPSPQAFPPTSSAASSPHAVRQPLEAKAASSSKLFVRRLADPDAVRTLIDMGFTEEDAISALLACDNDVNRACNVLTTKHPPRQGMPRN